MIYGDELSKKITALKGVDRGEKEEAALKAYEDCMKLYLECKDKQLNPLKEREVNHGE